MRTNVVLDDDLVHEAMKLTGKKTKKEVISYALQKVVALKKRRNLLDLAGKIQFQDDYDYKAMRKSR